MEGLGMKRKSDHNAEGPHKAPKLGNATGAKPSKMSFAQRMMAKMGYVEGQGLGRDGEGIVKPIEVKLRPQGAGVGTVKEKTKQAKDEERRRAEMRGEEYEDSSDEEKRKRKARQRAGQNTAGGRSATQSTGAIKKTKYRTVADVQAAVPGLDVPPTMLSSILDMTGSDRKLLTSSAGLLLPVVAAKGDEEVEREKLEKRERLEFEAFIDAWHGLQERKIYYEEHEGHHAVEISQLDDDLTAMKSLVAAVEELAMHDGPGLTWTALILKLSDLQDLRELHSTKNDVHEAAVASLIPQFKSSIESWDVLENPGMLVDDLIKISPILGHHDTHLIDLVMHNEDDDHDLSKQTPSSTAYETMMYTIWLPRVRRIAQTWDVSQYQPMMELLQAWTPILPRFISASLIDKVIVPKLKSALLEWDPAKRHRDHRRTSTKHNDPSLWLFPWLPHLPPYQLDTNEVDSLAVEIRRKVRHVLSGWRVTSGLVPGLADFKDLPDLDFDHLLVKYMLPRLATHLARELEINPADQNLQPLEQVLLWQAYYKPTVLARLLAVEFFPKWLSTLHAWLTSPDPSFDEIGAWLEWWTLQIPENLAQSADIIQGWKKGQDMIRNALDLLDAGKSLSTLKGPAVGPSKPISQPTRSESKPASHLHEPKPGAVDFREALEVWCAEEDLTLLPLREAHTTTGLPLLRVTASASGKGGVIGYIKGDVLWAQKKGDRSVYEPVGLDERLIERAEGK